jgi:hypothetical protein
VRVREGKVGRDVGSGIREFFRQVRGRLPRLSNQYRKSCRGVSEGRDSNPRPSAWEADILPLNYPRFYLQGEFSRSRGRNLPEVLIWISDWVRMMGVGELRTSTPLSEELEGYW